MNKLRDIFDPESDTNKAWDKRMEEMKQKAYEEEDCMTCKHYIPIDTHLPGCCTELPQCKLGGLAMEHCLLYERRTAWQEKERKTMDILITFKDGTLKVIHNAKEGRHNKDNELFMIEKDGRTAMIPRENVRYFGPKEFWIEDK